MLDISPSGVLSGWFSLRFWPLSNLSFSNLQFISEKTRPLLYCHILKPRSNDRNMPTQHIATLLGPTCCVRLATVLGHVGCCWLKFGNGQNWPNNTQHVATHRNTVAKRTQHVGPNNVAICCVGMLRLFGQGFRLLSVKTLAHGNFSLVCGCYRNSVRFEPYEK